MHHKVGLHARPAALFVKAANGFAARIILENLTKGTSEKNAKSNLSVLSAGVAMNDRIRIAADGDDAEAAVIALSDLIASNFGEAG